METRKIVKTGANTFTVSLPKEYIRANNLAKGDLLYLNNEGSKLILSKLADNKVKTKEITILIDSKEINEIRRETIAAYINNYNIFVFQGKKLNKKLEEIQKILNNFLALEIIEQSESRLVAKDFLNLEEFSLKKTIRRMDMQTRSLIIDSKDSKNYKLLLVRDFEIDKLYFLISRLTRANLNKNFNSIESFSVWWIAKNIEKIGDGAKEICKIYSKEINKFYDKVRDYYIESIESFFKNDKEKANKLMEKRSQLFKENDKIKAEQRIFLRDMIDSARNIAKTVLDS
jgi:phosphate uptake regulator